MKKYLFKTTATMKQHNNKKWWIDSGIIRDITIEAETTKKALEKYSETVCNNYGVNVSETALKNKAPMYQDNANGEPIQCGYVITASTEFDNDRRGWVTQYIDLWVSVAVVVNPFEGVKPCI